MLTTKTKNNPPKTFIPFLKDVFRASDVDLEWMFKLSFAYDIVNVSMLI